MSKKFVKLVLFGAPGTGKSTFASHSPNPLFLCSDGNFSWLGLPDKNHIRLSTYNQFKLVVNDLINTNKYDEFETVVVDLTEDLYVWAEYEFCKKNNIEHIGDYKSMGAGYSVVRRDFFAQISKLISVDKHVILISHEYVKVEKNRVGAELTKYLPSNKMSLDKQWDDIEGQVRYFLRAYMVPEEVEGKITKKRYLSLIPKENEYGISRGLDEATTPEDIPLDWNTFADFIGLEKEPAKPAAPKAEEVKKVEPKPTPVKPTPVKPVAPTPAPVEAPKVETPVVEEKPVEVEEMPEAAPVVEQPKPTPAPAPRPNPTPAPAPAPAPQPKPVEPAPAPAPAAPVEEPKPAAAEKPLSEMTVAERIAAIKAKYKQN